MPVLIIKPRSRIFHGHDWVYASEVLRTTGDPQPGDTVDLKDQRSRPMGSAIYNPKSQIVARRYSRRKQALDLEFFQRRLQRAAKLREDLPGIEPNLCRLIWSESDGMPGVIIDRYGDHFVLQTLTLAMDHRKEIIAEALNSQFSPKTIIARNDSPSRIAEGMESEEIVLSGSWPGPFEMAHDDLRFQINLGTGQKTGLYLDQLSNYTAVARHADGRRVLDCFTNQGGFALAASKAGASAVTAVDVSETALAQAKVNAEISGAGKILWVEANVFDDLKKRESEGQKFDLIVLDPPSFTRNKKSLKDAMRGYKEIHLRALKMLEPGGMLFTFTCSHHVGWGPFSEVIRDAANDAKRTIRLRESFTQRADHPVLFHLPETEYLKGFGFEVIGAF
ncbi:MAG: class I SAM-dependent rRNA methyltransferase [Verrucomicrobiota bacterium]